MDANGKIRLFVAVFPPTEVAERLSEAARGLAGGLSPEAVAWTRPEQIHLTLNFLGQVERGKVEEFQRAVAAACRGGGPFLLRARGLGSFPSPARARILWAGLDGAVAAVEGLKGMLDAGLAPLGHVPDERPFHPHLTLGRVRLLNGGDRRHLAAALPQWREADFGSWTVERVDLMQSVRLPGGAQYAPVQSFALQGPGVVPPAAESPS
jgi:RNA 2',3'-cyclic 3'-phosphodiesterase